jgi:branched-subunit amino acid aminotransferase/4-amino-4-deoxychorismate lyase
LPESEFQKAIRLFARDENSGKNFMIRFNLTQEMEGQVNPRLFLKRLPTLFATIRPLRHNPEDQYPIRGKVGISPWTAADNQTVPNWFKHSFYLTTRSVFRDHPDWDEILRLNHAGQVVDGGLSTPLWFNGKHVLAPPLRLGGLASVNREKMIALCRSLGIKVIEKAWKPQDVSRHGELFFVGSGIGVMSPTRLLGRKINKTNLMAVRFWHHYRSWALHKAII